MTEDDFETDDLADDVTDLEDVMETKRTSHTDGNVPVWRLIEMSRENRFLARELADFDDYDIVDGYAAGPGVAYMH